MLQKSTMMEKYEQVEGKPSVKMILTAPATDVHTPEYVEWLELRIEELVSTAERLRKELDEAYRYHPLG